jgi:hypothetical protein
MSMIQQAVVWAYYATVDGRRTYRNYSRNIRHGEAYSYILQQCKKQEVTCYKLQVLHRGMFYAYQGTTVICISHRIHRILQRTF